MSTQDNINMENQPTSEENSLNNDEVILSIEAQLEQAQNQADEYQQAWIRSKADMENLRKRNAEEIEKLRKFAIEGFANSLLPVMDSLQAALADNSSSIETLKQGVELTLKQLQSAFDKYKITCIEPVGQAFDPSFHQVISSIPSEEPNNTIISVVQKGYTISERLLREALVVVSCGKNL